MKFIPVESYGIEEVDEMVSFWYSSSARHHTDVASPQFLFQAKIGVYNDTPFSNPDLVALGVKFGSLKEFVEKEVVHRVA